MGEQTAKAPGLNQAFFNRCLGKVSVADVIRMTSNEMFGFGLDRKSVV